MHIPVYILAGGKSSRMQQDKALMLFNGKRLIDYALESAQLVSNEIYILTQNPLHQNIGWPCIADTVLDAGAGGGIDAMLAHSTHTKNILLSCDMPFVNAKAIETLLHAAEDYDITIPKFQNHPEPLLGIYQSRCKTLWREKLQAGVYKLSSLLDAFNVHYLDGEEMCRHNSKLFTNFNSLEDINNNR